MFKKIIVIIMIFCLIFPCGFAEQNYTLMTNEELHQVIDLARNELFTREMLYSENQLLFEDENISLYFTGNYQVDGYEDFWYITFEVILINNSEIEMWLGSEEAYINGWKVSSGMIEETLAGKKQKGWLDFTLSDANIYSFEEIEDIEFSYYFVEAENYEIYHESSQPVIIHFNH